jgi:nicotinamidase-related amidase
LTTFSTEPVRSSYEPLTRENALLIFVDLQVGPISSTRTIDPQELKQNAIALATVAQMFHLPTVFASGSQEGPGGVYLPELLNLLPDHIFVRHSTTNAWQTLAFRQAIEQVGRKKLIMGGIATDVGLLFPALSARASGYDVYIVSDVCGTLTTRGEQAAFFRMMQMGIIMTSWASLATEILQDFSSEHGMQILGLINQQLQADAGDKG